MAVDAAQKAADAARAEVHKAVAAHAKPTEPAKQPEARVVVYGDSDFASNAVLGVQGNRDLFMNIMNWLSSDEDLISIRPKDPEDRRLTMSASQMRMVAYSSVVAIPLIIIAAGVGVWWRRR